MSHETQEKKNIMPGLFFPLEWSGCPLFVVVSLFWGAADIFVHYQSPSRNMLRFVSPDRDYLMELSVKHIRVSVKLTRQFSMV